MKFLVDAHLPPGLCALLQLFANKSIYDVGQNIWRELEKWARLKLSVEKFIGVANGPLASPM